VNGPEVLLHPIVRRQDGAVTTAQAREAGVTHHQLKTLVAHGWSQPSRGVYVEPTPRDPFRAGLRAALLVCPEGVVSGRTAARVHKLSGLPLWTAAELPELRIAGKTRAQRPGMRLSFCLPPRNPVTRDGWPVTTVAEVISELCYSLELDDLVCLLDSALRGGWRPEDAPLSRRKRAHLGEALALSTGLSESALETLLRLLLVRAGVAPEVLQLELFTYDGRCYARLDMAWTSRRLAVEADGREHHDKPEALYRDRDRQNDVILAGWTVLRFTWYDVLRRPRWVVAQVRRALASPPVLPKA
jgi:hypothetical protein